MDADVAKQEIVSNILHRVSPSIAFRPSKGRTQDIHREADEEEEESG